MYKIKFSHILGQVVMGVVFILGALIIKNMIFIVISVFGGVLLFRDAYRQYFTLYSVDEKSLKVYFKGTISKEITWKKIDLVTKTRKNPKWIVVGSFEDIITLKNSIEGLPELQSKILVEAKKRKKIFIHDTLI